MNTSRDLEGAARQVETEYRYLSHGVEASSSLGRYLEWVRQAVLPRFVDNDRTAIDYQRRHHRVLLFIYGTAALVVGIVIMQTLFLPQLHQLIWFEVALIAAMLLVQTLDRHGRYRDRWMEHRFLAEKLRFAAFTLIWHDEGEISSSIASARSLLETGLRHQSWQEALSRIDLSAKPEVEVADEMPRVMAFIRENWLENQRRYFAKTKERNHRALNRMEGFGLVLLLVTILAAVLHALGVGHHTPISGILGFLEPSAHAAEGGGGHYEGSYTVGNLLIVLAILFPAVSASMNAIKHSLEHHKLCLRAARALDGIVEYERLLDQVPDAATLGRLVHDMDHFFMLEHEEWYALVSNKSVDVG